MLSYIYLWMMFVSIIYVHTLPITSSDTDFDNQKYSDTAMINRLALHQLVFDHPYENSLDEDDIYHHKRQIKKKWSKLHQGNPSPYTIAFPALIRSRRDMNEIF